MFFPLKIYQIVGDDFWSIFVTFEEGGVPPIPQGVPPGPQKPVEVISIRFLVRFGVHLGGLLGQVLDLFGDFVSSVFRHVSGDPIGDDFCRF